MCAQALEINRAAARFKLRTLKKCLKSLDGQTGEQADGQRRLLGELIGKQRLVVARVGVAIELAGRGVRQFSNN
jgi:hypothetical protein